MIYVLSLVAGRLVATQTRTRVSAARRDTDADSQMLSPDELPRHDVNVEALR